MLRNCLLLLAAISLTSCGDGIDRGSKAVFPVTGVILVDGKAPGSVLQIGVHEQGGIDKEDPSVSSGISNEDGTFALSTYVTGDGVPKGEYTLTFTWKEFNAFSANYSGKDKLNNRYSDVETSEVKFTVDGSGPVDLGTIELTTQE